MIKTWDKLCLLIMMAFLLTLTSLPDPAYARWPPFRFDLTPGHADGKITYTLKFYKEVDWPMADVTFKIPLPAGTRFLEAQAQPTTRVDFDGAEITFFTSVLHEPIRNANFTVEVIDPALTLFTTQAWIAWKGNQPGDYLTDPVTLDLTQQTLAWARPGPRLKLEMTAVVVGDSLTYTIYPKNVGGRRMWDLKINVPVPEKATFLMAEAPLPFIANFDGREVSFSTVELAEQTELEPLRFQVSTAGVTAPLMVTHAWATWKNVGRSVGRQVVFQEEVRSGDLIVQPGAPQYVVADMMGDTPRSNYDLTSIALQEAGTTLKITFYIAAEPGPAAEPLEYMVYLDRDCRIDTGVSRGGQGVEYWVRYRHALNRADLYTWDEQEGSWSNRTSLESNQPSGNKMVTVYVPYNLLEPAYQFCWVGRSRNRTQDFNSNLPNDWLSDPRLTQYQVLTTTD